MTGVSQNYAGGGGGASRTSSGGAAVVVGGPGGSGPRIGGDGVNDANGTHAVFGTGSGGGGGGYAEGVHLLWWW